MRLLKKTLINVVLPCFVFFAANVLADDMTKADEKFQLDTITCWEVLTASEEDTAYALVLLYVYNSGLDKQTKHSAKEIETTIATTGEVCSANPDMSALKAFQSAK